MSRELDRRARHRRRLGQDGVGSDTGHRWRWQAVWSVLFTGKQDGKNTSVLSLTGAMAVVADVSDVPSSNTLH